MIKRLLIVSVCSIALAGCGGSGYIKPPVDTMIAELTNEPRFTIILEDMDMVSGTFSNTYKHKYKVLVEREQTFEVPDTIGSGDSTVIQTKIVTEMVPTIVEKYNKWYDVDKRFFNKNQENLGMAIVTKSGEGEISKVAAPPGYNNYVGNRRYGYWGGGFWHWYGQYAFMSSMMGMAMSPIYRSNYTNYQRNYRGSRPYYGGTATSPKYGTNSSHMRKSKPNFFSRRASNSSWSRSASRTSGVGTSRYNSSSRTRSSGWGFGK